MHHCIACSLSTAPSLTTVRVAQVLGLETREGLRNRKGEFICRDSRFNEPALCLALTGAMGWTLTADVSWLPSCSCYMPTCSSGTSVEWRCSGCAVQCHSVEMGDSSAYIWTSKADITQTHACTDLNTNSYESPFNNFTWTARLQKCVN